MDVLAFSFCFLKSLEIRIKNKMYLLYCIYFFIFFFFFPQPTNCYDKRWYNSTAFKPIKTLNSKLGGQTRGQPQNITPRGHGRSARRGQLKTALTVINKTLRLLFLIGVKPEILINITGTISSTAFPVSALYAVCHPTLAVLALYDIQSWHH